MLQGYPTYIRESGIQHSWKMAPVAFETCWDMRKWVNDGWSLRYIFNYALACHASVINNKSAPLPQGANVRPEIERFLRRLGYRFVLKELKHPTRVKVGKDFDILMKWQNVGSAPSYRPYELACRLEKEGVSLTCMTTIKNLLPGSIEPFTSDFFKMPKDLPPGKMVPVTLTFSWWSSDIPPGEYSLSIGVVDLYARPAAVPTDKWKAIEALIQAGFEPAIRLGIKGRAADGWYPLSKIQVVK